MNAKQAPLQTDNGKTLKHANGKLRDRISNKMFQDITIWESIAQRAASTKWKWGRHVVRLQDDIWEQTTTMCNPTQTRRLKAGYEEYGRFRIPPLEGGPSTMGLLILISKYFFHTLSIFLNYHNIISPIVNNFLYSISWQDLKFINLIVMLHTFYSLYNINQHVLLFLLRTERWINIVISCVQIPVTEEAHVFGQSEGF